MVTREPAPLGPAVKCSYPESTWHHYEAALGETFLRVANMTGKPVRLLSPGSLLRVARPAGKAARAGA